MFYNCKIKLTVRKDGNKWKRARGWPIKRLASTFKGTFNIRIHEPERVSKNIIDDDDECKLPLRPQQELFWATFFVGKMSQKTKRKWGPEGDHLPIFFHHFWDFLQRQDITSGDETSLHISPTWLLTSCDLSLDTSNVDYLHWTINPPSVWETPSIFRQKCCTAVYTGIKSLTPVYNRPSILSKNIGQNKSLYTGKYRTSPCLWVAVFQIRKFIEQTASALILSLTSFN